MPRRIAAILLSLELCFPCSLTKRSDYMKRKKMRVHFVSFFLSLKYFRGIANSPHRSTQYTTLEHPCSNAYFHFSFDSKVCSRVKKETLSLQGGGQDGCRRRGFSKWDLLILNSQELRQHPG